MSVSSLTPRRPYSDLKRRTASALSLSTLRATVTYHEPVCPAFFSISPRSLVGSQNTVVAVGTLKEVGSDYITIFHPGRSAYITADIYSIRFVEFPQGNNVVTLN